MALALQWIPNGCLEAQIFTTLHNFSTNGDGSGASTDLVLAGDTIFGTTPAGGSLGYGTMFRLNKDGSGYTNLQNFTYSFTGYSPCKLVPATNGFYGIVNSGGQYGEGAVFRINSDGSGLTNLHDFTRPQNFNFPSNSDGAWPTSLILSGGYLYGSASSGGSSGNGTIFRMNTDGSGLTNIYEFSLGSGSSQNPLQRVFNTDGAEPTGIVLSGNLIYGTTYSGGTFGNGAIFSVNTDGSGFTNLHSFADGIASSYSETVTNTDGAHPDYGLTLVGNALCGTTFTGGAAGNGTLFKINTDGSGFANLHVFTAGLAGVPALPLTNSDGLAPRGNLTLFGQRLCGVTGGGGHWGNGTVFSIQPDGSDFRSIYQFTPASLSAHPTNNDGAFPQTTPLLSGDTLYGTTPQEGNSGLGTIFSLSFAPRLTITGSLANVVVTWPTNVAGYDCSGYILQTSVSLGSSNAWCAVTNPVSLANGTFIATNSIDGTQRYYRLSR